MKDSMQVRGSILLGAAFAGLLLVVGASSLAVWRSATTAQERVTALHNAHMQAGEALANIRANVYLTGIITRNYLLDWNPAHTQEYINQFNAVQAKTEESFRVLEASAQDAAQKATIQRLRKEVQTHWDPTEIVLDWTPQEKRQQGNRALRVQLNRRQEIFELTAEVEQLMTENFTRERARITSADREFRSSLGWITVMALLFGFGIAGATMGRMLSLERQSQGAETALRLLSVQLRTAQEQERKRLSRELHDQVGQMLTGLKMQLAGIGRLLGDSESDLSSRIANAKGTVEQTLRIVRNIAMLLRPSMLDDLGLTPALAWLVKEVSRSSGMEIQTDIAPELDSLPEAHRTCIYRVTQEALTNAVRHSGAGKVDLTLKIGGEWVTGVIMDNGRGFDPTAGRRKGLGLLGLEERVRELNGTLRVASAPGRGTRVEIRLPYPKGPMEDDKDTHRGRSRNRPDGLETPA